jgi:hypothetical protein
LVVKAKPVRGLSGEAPGLEVTFPDDIVVNAGKAGGQVVAEDAESEP